MYSIFIPHIPLVLTINLKECDIAKLQLETYE